MLGTQASVVVAHGLWLLRGMWNLLGPGIEPMSPALAGGFLFFCFFFPVPRIKEGN